MKQAYICSKDLCALVVFLSGFLILFAIVSREKQPNESDELFIPAEVNENAFIPQSDSVKRFRFVNISPDVFQNFWLQDDALDVTNFILPLFDDVTLSMEITKIEVKTGNQTASTLSITGGIAGEQYAISTLTLKQDALFAQMTIPGKKYRIVPVQPPLHRIDELDTERSTDTLILN